MLNLSNVNYGIYFIPAVVAVYNRVAAKKSQFHQVFPDICQTKLHLVSKNSAVQTSFSNEISLQIINQNVF